MTEPTIAPYGSWSSPLPIERLTEGVVFIGEVRGAGGVRWWLEGRPEEQGRQVLVRRDPDGTMVRLTPEGFNARTRVHEYGGAATLVSGDLVLVSDFSTGRLHRVVAPGELVPLTPERAWRFADLEHDLANGRLLVYNSPSSGACPGIDIVEIPLSNPAGASYLRFEPAGRSCHDTGVILGDVNLTACAGGNGFTVWSMDAASGGSLEDPMQLYSRSIDGVSIGHSASFTWDGSVLIFGHEPGGGAGARCQATSSVTDRSLFFFEASSGTLLGTFLHPRPQTNLENCTWHNYNIVPTDKRYVIVSGNYQSGISVVDFTNPAAAQEIAFADPAPLSSTSLILGGDWSTYWYNGRIYESDITRGLIVWNLSDKVVAGAMKFDHLNPQTQETSFAFKGTAFGTLKGAADQQGFVVFGESAPGDVSGGAGGGEDFGGEGGN